MRPAARWPRSRTSSRAGTRNVPPAVSSLPSRIRLGRGGPGLCGEGCRTLIRLRHPLPVEEGDEYDDYEESSLGPVRQERPGDRHRHRQLRAGGIGLSIHGGLCTFGLGDLILGGPAAGASPVVAKGGNARNAPRACKKAQAQAKLARPRWAASLAWHRHFLMVVIANLSLAWASSGDSLWRRLCYSGHNWAHLLALILAV